MFLILDDEPEDDPAEDEEMQVPQNVIAGAEGNLFRRMFIQQHF